MGIIGGQIGELILRRFAPREHSSLGHDASDLLDTKLTQFFGDDFIDIIRGKTILDFGCGSGKEAVAMALMGAAKVIGLDTEEKRLTQARELSLDYSVGDRCTFVTNTQELVDVIISKDAFEHFSDPASILQQMSLQLKPTGLIMAAFGPTWLHPLGGHLFSVFPWAHLVFSEHTLLRWRSRFKSDGATRFAEVEGGLNQLTIKRFEQFVADSNLSMNYFETVPIKGIRFLKYKVLREIGSSIVRCRLTLRH